MYKAKLYPVFGQSILVDVYRFICSQCFVYLDFVEDCYVNMILVLGDVTVLVTAMIVWNNIIVVGVQILWETEVELALKGPSEVSDIIMKTCSKRFHLDNTEIL